MTDNEAIARDTYRPDLYRAALKPLGVALPGANAKVEGALQGRRRSARPAPALCSDRMDFSTATIFDPDDLDAYMSSSDSSRLRR